jgi:heme exporter protein C
MDLSTRFANPAHFTRLADRLIPVCMLAAVAAFTAGLYYALFNSPPDYQQGETVRIMYVHVPSAWIGMGLYMSMAIAAGVGLVARHALADVFCVAAAPVGATLVALCLITGSLWGKPTWGAWWVWDARLTSVLILFLLYCGYIALRHSFDDDERGGKAGAILLLVGAVNIPIVKFSVEWWNTLHQPASLMRKGGAAIDPQMLRPLLLMGAAYGFYAASIVMQRMKSVLLARKIERAREME